jgi:hypothetical protein
LIALVTLVQAKAQLNEVAYTNYFDETINQKIFEASAIVLDYMKVDLGSPEQLPWTTVPFTIQAIVLQMTANLFRERENANILSENVKAVLAMYRVPTMA